MSNENNVKNIITENLRFLIYYLYELSKTAPKYKINIDMMGYIIFTK